jgi:ligand-binding SRPBCC domain-containing protein
MSFIHLTTFIKAETRRVFDLSRSINLHQISTMETNEKAIAGIINGLINVNETVTWQANHLYKTRLFTSRIVEMQIPDFFIDEMIKGDFKSFRHEHHFKSADNGTIMIDKLTFESPFGIIGKLVNEIYLKNYLQKLVEKRNVVIKDYAETGKWKAILN